MPSPDPLTLLDNTILVSHIDYVTKEQYQVRRRETVELENYTMSSHPVDHSIVRQLREAFDRDDADIVCVYLYGTWHAARVTARAMLI
jgi:hypothetical protein